MLWKFFKRSATSKPAPKPSARPASSNLSGTKPSAAPKQPGYDPYNSGAFDKRGSWDKVTRK